MLCVTMTSFICIIFLKSLLCCTSKIFFINLGVFTFQKQTKYIYQGEPFSGIPDVLLHFPKRHFSFMKIN